MVGLETRRDERLEGVGVIEASVFEAALRYTINAKDIPFCTEEISPVTEIPFSTFLHALLLYDKLTVDANFFDEVTRYYWRQGFSREKFYDSEWVHCLSATDTFDRRLRRRDFELNLQRSFVRLYSHKLIASPALKSACGQLTVANCYDRSFVRVLTRSDAAYLDGTGLHVKAGVVLDPVWSDIPNEYRAACGFLFRSLAYAGFSQSYFQHHRIPCVYVALPGRIRALKEFLDASDFDETMEFGQYGYLDLLDSSSILKYLGVPLEGYSFRHFGKTLNPIEFSSASAALSQLDPMEALKRVTELRQTEHGRNIRQEWARRVWAHSQSAAEGLPHTTTTLGVAASTIQGDLTLVFNQTLFASAETTSAKEGRMASKQQITDVEVGGSIEQRSNVQSEQILNRVVAAGDVRQLIDVVEASRAIFVRELAYLHAE